MSVAADVMAESVHRLEVLRACLDRTGWRTRLLAPPGRVPCLRVQNPLAGATGMSEDIACAPRDGTWLYWWSWNEPICADPGQAAAAIARVLWAAGSGNGPASGPGRGR
jgi:hypothetical protein